MNIRTRSFLAHTLSSSLVASLTLACGDGDAQADDDTGSTDGAASTSTPGETTASPSASSSGEPPGTSSGEPSSSSGEPPGPSSGEPSSSSSGELPGTTGDTAGTTGDTAGTTGDTGDTGDTGGTTGDTAGTTGVLEIQRIGRYAPEPLADLFDQGAAEIAAYDPISQSLFVTNGMTDAIDVLDLSNPTTPTLLQSITINDPTLAGPTSVAVQGGVVAVAIPSATPAQPGQVLFFDVDGSPLSAVTVGPLPDMLTFDPGGQRVLVANEGEPTGYGPGESDPEGSVSIIDVSAGAENVVQGDVSTAGFGGWQAGDLDGTTRVFGPGSTVAQDLEPEYVAVSADGATAWATLQENNALAIIDVATATVTGIVGMGVVDHSLTGLDPSDQDGAIAIATHPVFGMRQPDSIAAFEAGGSGWLVTANEGDARDYDGLDEEQRVSQETLDPAAFPDAAALQLPAALGRLGISVPSSDVDGDGDLDRLWAFGSRSVSIFDAAGVLVWDSGDAMEQVTAAAHPGSFNASHDANPSFDNRSDNKGPEPEGLAVGSAFGTRYLFVGLERVGGFMVWDVGDPTAPVQWGYVNPRDFGGDPEAGTADDLGPEGLLFVSAADSPTGNPLVVVTHEISGTVSIYELTLAPV